MSFKNWMRKTRGEIDDTLSDHSEAKRVRVWIDEEHSADTRFEPGDGALERAILENVERGVSPREFVMRPVEVGMYDLARLNREADQILESSESDPQSEREGRIREAYGGAPPVPACRDEELASYHRAITRALDRTSNEPQSRPEPQSGRELLSFEYAPSRR